MSEHDAAFSKVHLIRYGDSDAARAAVAYYRARGWVHIDSEDVHADSDEIATRVYSFIAGYNAAQEAR